MEKDLIKYVITNHKERFLSKQNLVHREILNHSDKLIESREIIFITGIRRSGKSSLMRLICSKLLEKKIVARENILFINFEDERLMNFLLTDFELLFQTYKEIENPKGKLYLFFDEIQYVKGWERWISRLYEFENVKIFITGSNASLLQSEISNVLTGRNRELFILPFSFKEYLWQNGYFYDEKDIYLEKTQIELKRYCNNYIISGGFPEVLKNKDVALLDQYFKDIIYRDVLVRHAIRNVRELKELSLYIISNIGTISSYDSLRKVVSAHNTTTIKNYINILVDVFMVIKLSLFDYSIKKQIYNPDKYYTIDTGFYTALGFRFSDNAGRRLENIVCIELMRRKCDIYYWKSSKGYEVDFIIKRADKPKVAIQVSSEITKSNEDRETKALLAAADELNIKELFIITGYQEKKMVLGKSTITVVPVWKWLLFGAREGQKGLKANPA